MSNTANGSPKKRGKKKAISDSEDDASVGSSSDFEIDTKQSAAAVARSNTRRAAAVAVKYNVDESEDDETEPVLYDNDAIKENDVQQNFDASSDSDAPPSRPQETSENMFDSLIGKTTIIF